MNMSSTRQKWVLFGVVMIANGLMVSNWLNETPDGTLTSRPVVVATDHPSQTAPAKAGPDARSPETHVAAAPTETPTHHGNGPLAQAPVRQATRTASASAPPDRPVYMDGPHRVALQPRMVQALRQLIDTSHDGLKITTLANGIQLVNTPNKFLHVAVAARAPDGRILQQDFSTNP